ncbi:hypothetical protein BHF71_02170 [Vulcanibacillus modesticaldus]|uniref:Methyltransferase type 11 domain-containing protein n=1 Tax=Vulcanibacillus modesticaldus TaxID=337097 RepID=A0A1D2YUR6_9BACI|nr:class I SAM-dependent methyltransferase [Vulcanibacillus modesticaldus]OEF99411.1 hypothetical protein BHF71_02170 [Vulcanibacillus modesticaldus]
MAWFDRFAKNYDSWYETKLGRFVDEVEKRLIAELANFQSGEKVLDIGAGTGNYSIWLAKKGLHVTAIDQSTPMMELAKKKAYKEGLRIDWEIADAHSLPFSDESFDLVISVTAIEFMEHPDTVLKEAMRVLRPKGRLVIGLLTKDSDWGELYQKNSQKDSDSVFKKAHLYTEQELFQLLPQTFKLKKGLYFPPQKEFDIKAAWNIEIAKQREQAIRAGFFALRWDKE